jgi:3-hydroxybutyryl-CoA dehydrogenase
MDIKTVCVCGAGTMGSGIAQVAATAGFKTILYELNEGVLEKAKKSISAGLKKLTEKGKFTEAEAAQIFNDIIFTNKADDCKADLVIEAIIENIDIKTDLFKQLSAINEPTTIFASNTSSLSINVLAEKAGLGDRFAGLHFFNPAPIMKLVEIVKGDHSSDETIQTLLMFSKKAGKQPVVCKDSPGFIVNRVARPFYIEALRIAEENKISMETIDTLMENAGFKLGPFKLMDLIGNDVNYAVSCSVYEQLNQPERLKPSYIQKEKVEKGELGRKTGKGYYDYSDKSKT